MATQLSALSKLATKSSSTSKTSISIPRNLSSKTSPRQVIASLSSQSESIPSSLDEASLNTTTMVKAAPPLSILPVKLLLRGIAINSVSCSPILLPLSLKALDILAHSKSAVLNPDSNPLLRWVLKNSFYAHFCAGENRAEVSETIKTLKDMGYAGVMLCYAKEVVLDEEAAQELEASGGKATEAVIQNEILPWKKGTLETVSLAEPGDFVALKFTGAGSQALYNLSKNLDPSPVLEESITDICDLAHSRGVKLVFDAEQASLQKGIDAWTLRYMQRYNKKSAIVFCTYQAYLKAAPEVLASHLAIARKENFVAGVKLVRGAYINSDPRHLIHDTKANTGACYDALAESVMRRSYGEVLKPVKGEETNSFPQVSLALACHNILSVRKAMKIRKEQSERGEEKIELVYAQLQGMADEVSCELVQRAQTEKVSLGADRDVPMAYKYLVWGTTGECMKYLLRRAQENKDAVARTREGRDEMAKEAVRKVKALFGWSA